ncbi:14522_t:CDS:2 [Gigaspora rosea]|nr:14522_t:CDS:2 [Gigaspora rosea]
MNVNVIIPYYSFLKEKYKATKYIQLGIKIRDDYGQWKVARFSIFKFIIKTSENKKITVFMIGSTSNLPPFNHTHQKNHFLWNGEIYIFLKPLQNSLVIGIPCYLFLRLLLINHIWIAREMVEGPLDFDFKELVLPNILNKASIGRWVDISYGFDVKEPNPFKNKILEESNAIFPKNLDTLNPLDLYDNNVNNISTEDLITVSKLNAKKYLIQEGLLSEEDLECPLVLFDGKFEVIGFQFFRETIKVREQWAVQLYAAADIQYVPDLSENFGLVWYTDEEFIDSSVEGLKSALLMAVDDWRKMSIDLVKRELFVRRLIKDALKLDWCRIGGPIEQYRKVYKMAILQISDKLETDVLWN